MSSLFFQWFLIIIDEVLKIVQQPSICKKTKPIHSIISPFQGVVLRFFSHPTIS